MTSSFTRGFSSELEKHALKLTPATKRIMMAGGGAGAAGFALQNLLWPERDARGEKRHSTASQALKGGVSGASGALIHQIINKAVKRV